ncbi:MAG: lipopolysaccharide biosynthesis protein [Promethearchaeota archaeon]
MENNESENTNNDEIKEGHGFQAKQKNSICSKSNDSGMVIEKISKENIAKGSLLITILNYIILFGDIAISFITPAFLSLDEIGLYRSLYNYIPLVSFIIYMGMKNTATKFITRYDNMNDPRKSNAAVFFITLINTSIGLFFMIIFLIFSKQFSYFLKGTEIYADYVKLLAVQFLFVPIMVFNQFFISRYKFRTYFIGNFSGQLLRIILFIFFLFKGYKINSYLYSGIIGQSVIFVYLLASIFIEFKNPNFNISFKEIIKFALPLYLSDFFRYLKSQFYGIIFVKFINLDAQFGLLSYIRIIFNAVLIIFNAMNSVLTVYYAKVIYHKNAKVNYTKTTYEFSKIFTMFSFIIGFLFMGMAPIYIKIITTLYDYDSLYSLGAITMILYGFYFILNLFYYIAPTIINIHNKSYKLLEIHGFSVIAYLAGYIIFIRNFGMLGIPISLSLGFTVFILLCYRDIKKQGYTIGFDKKNLLKILIASIPLIIIIPIEYLFALNDESIFNVNLGFNIFKLPRISLLFNSSLILLCVGVVLFIIRQIHFFTEADRPFLKQIFGKRLSPIILKILIK